MAGGATDRYWRGIMILCVCVCVCACLPDFVGQLLGYIAKCILARQFSSSMVTVTHERERVY